MNIQDIQEKYELSKEPNVDFWHHQQSGKWILTHSAVEKIAHIEGVELVDIKVLNSEMDLVRLLITMKLGEKTTSTIGEADRKNCHSQYLGAMSEKRGYDRAVLKLIHAYEYGISSEVEADDFKKPDSYTVTDEQKNRYQELLNSGAYEGEKQNINKWWKTFTTFDQAEKGLSHMEKHVDKVLDYKEDQKNEQQSLIKENK